MKTYIIKQRTASLLKLLLSFFKALRASFRFGYAELKVQGSGFKNPFKSFKSLILLPSPFGEGLGVRLLFTFLFSLFTLTSCSEFFDPSTDDELNGEDYISSNTEMYTGFLGIMTKLQAIGDKEILLTDTRAELLEPSAESNADLIALYNYDENLKGNSYADPSGYYEVIIACNDYLAKMLEYKKNVDVDQNIANDLISSAARIKMWTYKTIGEIYGKAVWFDDPITEVKDLKDTKTFQLLTMEQIVDKCIGIMDAGYHNVPLNRTINWIEWLDPSNVTSIASSSYRKWNYMVPPFEGIYAELCLWKGAYLDAAGADSKEYYKRAADRLLSALSTQIECGSDPGSNVYWLPSAATPGHYSPIWNYAQPYPYESISALIYDYTNNQTNTLLKHFSNEYPNKYWLRPSAAGEARFLDASFNPGTSTNDTRYKTNFGTSNGVRYIAKFRPVGSSVRTNAYQDDVHIFIYRAMQYHIMLAEALNHLNRFEAMNRVFNIGFSGYTMDATLPEWEGFSIDWTSSASWGTRRYPGMGIRGCFSLNAAPVKTNIVELGQQGTWRYNDMSILNEYLLEFACEGKTYPAMNRFAVRYNDLSIIADRICPKYVDTGKDAEIRSRILAGGNWVPYEL